MLRRLVIASTDTTASAERRQALRDQFAELGRRGEEEVALARAKLAARLARQGGFDDVVAVARLDTRLGRRSEEHRGRYEVAGLEAARSPRPARRGTVSRAAGLARRSARRLQPHSRRRPPRHAPDRHAGRGGNQPTAATGSVGQRAGHGHRRPARARLRRGRRQRSRSAGPPSSRRHEGGPGRTARLGDPRDVPRRDRSAHRGVQPHDRGAPAEGADPRHLRTVRGPAHRRRADRPARADRKQRRASDDDRPLLRHAGIHSAQRANDAFGDGHHPERVSQRHVQGRSRARGDRRQVHRRRRHGFLGPALQRPRGAEPPRVSGGAGAARPARRSSVNRSPS